MKKIFILLLSSTIWIQNNYSQTCYQYDQQQIRSIGYSGAVIIIKQDKVILKRACCLSRHEWNINSTSQTKFSIGSVNEEFTAACILELIEQKKLTLDDRLSKFFPGFQNGDSVTILVLLNHTSGVADCPDLAEFTDVGSHSLNRDSLIAVFKDKPSKFSPGAKWSYSNTDYFLLTLIVEKTSGQSYDDYLCQNILYKLNISEFCSNGPGSIISVNAGNITSGFSLNAGIIYSNPEDLYKCTFDWSRVFKGISIPY